MKSPGSNRTISAPTTPRASAEATAASPAISQTLRRVDKLYVDLADWAPPPTVSTSSANTAAHLPPLPKTPPSPSTGSNRSVQPTSYPNTHLNPLQQSISHSLSKLLSEDVFLRYLQSPVGYTQFHSYLSTFPSNSAVASASSLELWRDLQVLKELERRAAVASRGIRDVYLIDGHKKVDVPLPVMRDLVGGLRGVIGGVNGLEKPSRALLDALYASEFEGFVQYRLLKHTSVALGQYNLDPNDRKGL